MRCIMEIFIYRTYEEWIKDKPSEVIEGNVIILENGTLYLKIIILYI